MELSNCLVHKLLLEYQVKVSETLNFVWNRPIRVKDMIGG